ncbi:MAG: hypothetical protein ACI4E5_08375 [Suilimivivens sp.]
MRRLIENMKLYTQKLILMLLCLLGFFLLGVLMVCAILGLEDTAVSWVSLGTLMGMIGVVTFSAICILSFCQDFMLALSMGMTRREFMITYALEQLVLILLAYIGLLLGALLESAIYPVMFPKAFEKFSILSYLTDWKIVVPSVLAFVLLPMFFGTLYSRFGKKFGVILYIIWMVLCLLGARVGDLASAAGVPSQVGNMPGWLTTIPIIGWVIVGAIAAIAMIFTIIHLGMKQMVK